MRYSAGRGSRGCWVSMAMALISASSALPVMASGSTGVALGRALFEDKSLSADRSVACASCHSQDHAFADTRSVSIGTGRHSGTRNTPSLLGISEYRYLFWDGRADTLEGQAAFPLYSPIEMGLSGEKQLVKRVRQNPRYVRAFQKLSGTDSDRLGASDIVNAIAAYERSLTPGATAFDDYMAGNGSALSTDAKAGLALFRGRAGCSSCHLLSDESSPFTDNRFHESAVGMRSAGAAFAALALELTRLPLTQRSDLVPSDPRVAALGRFVITLDPKDIGGFRTPSLRNAAATAPYMHDGSVATLQAAVDLELYYRGLQQGYPVNLSLAERRDIRLFIESATAVPVRRPKVSQDKRTASQPFAAAITVSTKHE
jgi:cytochrome c peroxidase